MGVSEAAVAVSPEPEIVPLDPARDQAAANVLATATVEGTVDQSQKLLAAARAKGATVFARVAGEELVAVAVVRVEGLTAELDAIAVAPGYCGQGHGRACLEHALLLVGRRPLAVETDEATLGFYRACGFKLVGKRRRPDGAFRYRLAAHAKRPDASSITLHRSHPARTSADRPA